MKICRNMIWALWHFLRLFSLIFCVYILWSKNYKYNGAKQIHFKEYIFFLRSQVVPYIPFVSSLLLSNTWWRSLIVPFFPPFSGMLCHYISRNLFNSTYIVTGKKKDLVSSSKVIEAFNKETLKMLRRFLREMFRKSFCQYC